MISSKIITQATISNPCLMFDALADVSKEAISVAASALGARFNMVSMLSTGGVVGPLIGMVVGNLVGDMVDILDDV